MGCSDCQHRFSPQHFNNADVWVCRHQEMQKDGNRLIGNRRYQNLPNRPDWCPLDEMPGPQSA